MIRYLCVALSLFFLASCGSDEPRDSGGDDTGVDSGADAPAECPDDIEPADGDPCDCEGDTFEGRIDTCDRTCQCEFGFWTCEENCDTPDVLSLSFSGDPAVTEQSGNGDALVNPGEVWTITGSVVAANAPPEGAPTTVRLRSDTIFVDTDGSVAEIGALREEPVEFVLPFSVSEDAPPALLALTLEAFSGFATTDQTVNVEVVATSEASLEWRAIELQDEGGAPAVRIEAGDRVVVAATLYNSGAIPAEDVTASASASSSSLRASTAEISLGVIAAGGESNVEFVADVVADPTDLSPTITLAASSSSTETVTETIDVPIFAPDTLEVASQTWTGREPIWTLQVRFENTGRFPITGVEWTAVNYASPPPPSERADPPQCSTDEDCDFGPELSFRCDVTFATCVEDPLIESMGFGEASGPESVDAGGTVLVEIPLAVTEATPAFGRLILRANSDLRSHGPFALELDRP